MWRGINSGVEYNDEQLESEIMSSGKGMFFLDGPSGCGKTYFLKHMKREVLTAPFCEVTRTIYEGLKDGKKSGLILADLERLYECEVLGLEDIDSDLAGKVYMQAEAAHLIGRLVETRKIILTGIDIDRRCGDLLRFAGEDKYEYYRYAG